MRSKEERLLLTTFSCPINNGCPELYNNSSLKPSQNLSILSHILAENLLHPSLNAFFYMDQMYGKIIKSKKGIEKIQKKKKAMNEHLFIIQRIIHVMVATKKFLFAVM